MNSYKNQITKSLNVPKILEESVKIILFDKLTFHQTPPPKYAK